MSPIASWSQMLPNSFPDDLYIFRVSHETHSCFPSLLLFWCFGLLRQNVGSHVVPTHLWGERMEMHTSYLTLIWQIRMAWVNLWPRIFRLCHLPELLRCRWWQKWGEMNFPPDVYGCVCSASDDDSGICRAGVHHPANVPQGFLALRGTGWGSESFVPLDKYLMPFLVLFLRDESHTNQRRCSGVNALLQKLRYLF